MFRYAFVTCITVFLVLTPVSTVMALEFAVSPMLLEKTAKPKSTKAFQFTIHSKSKGRIKLTVYNMQQLKSGHMSFIDAKGVIPGPMIKWIKLDKKRYRIKKEETISVTGKIQIPAKANGDHLAAIMVEEDRSPSQEMGIVVNVRYAVIINLKVNGRKARARSLFSQAKIENIKGRLVISGLVENISPFSHWLFSTAQLRQLDKRLVEKLTLKTESAWQRKDSGSRIYPNATVRVYGEIRKNIKPGKYLLMLRNKFGGRFQPAMRTEIIITEEMLNTLNKNTPPPTPHTRSIVTRKRGRNILLPTSL